MFGSGLRGPGMIFLQILRGFTIIGLLAAVVACWTLIIKIDTSNGWFFFDATSLFFTSSAAVFLIVSELPIAKSYFRQTWPVLSEHHGLTWLGVAMILIGCNVLGKLNQSANSADNLGLPFWRLVLAAGILSLTFGVVNIIASLIFRDSANGINARIVRIEGELATSRDDESFHKPMSSHSSSLNEKPRNKFMSVFWKNRGDENASTRPNISQPIPRDVDIERNAGPHFDHSHINGDAEYEEERRSPIVPTVRRPDTALHPMNTGRRSSYYSEAHMSRF
ncbi:hypothetical protein BHE90_002150 [Fusarium euwallaceae]|uniref:DUF7598 domain-containing protein n=2 Tax=Fusarium solani species complex TaxID=232080 RepID=A0A428U5Z8_9HYPO|nr:hypothetical protein CEP52_003997 [Fusarium oligoseptatum]RTE83295.1 hypothetical protein BHE90_002150 [Fusarium euwallaceae]